MGVKDLLLGRLGPPPTAHGGQWLRMSQEQHDIGRRPAFDGEMTVGETIDGHDAQQVNLDIRVV